MRLPGEDVVAPNARIHPRGGDKRLLGRGLFRLSASRVSAVSGNDFDGISNAVFGRDWLGERRRSRAKPGDVQGCPDGVGEACGRQCLAGKGSWRDTNFLHSPAPEPVIKTISDDDLWNACCKAVGGGADPALMHDSRNARKQPAVVGERDLADLLARSKAEQGTAGAGYDDSARSDAVQRFEDDRAQFVGAIVCHAAET